MPRYAFEAIDPAGALVRGTLDADSNTTAVEQLLAGGQTPVLVREARDGEGLLARMQSFLGQHNLDYVLVLRELATLLKAGLTVERAFVLLEGLSGSAANALRLKQILDRVRGGEPLSRAFGQVMHEAPPYVGRLIAAGEASGQLPDVVQRLASGLIRARALRSRVLSSLTYPALLVLATMSVLVLVFTNVLPRLTPMFEEAGVALPFATQLLLGLGWFVQWFGLPVLLALAGGLLWFRAAWRRPDSRLAIDRRIFQSRLTLAVPQRLESARFCHNLETLLGGGLSLERALAAAREGASNSYFRARILIAESAVAEGERLRTGFSKADVLPSLVLELAGVGEETGRLGPMMGEAASILDDEVATRLDRLTALVMPVATLVMGGVVALIMAGIVSGILAVNDLAT